MHTFLHPIFTLLFLKKIEFILCKCSRKMLSVLDCFRLTHSERKYVNSLDVKYTQKTFVSLSNKNIEKLEKISLC